MKGNSLLDELRGVIKPPIEALRQFEGLVRVVSHYDADGITAAGIMAKALLREGKRFRLSFVKGVNSEVFRKLEHEGFVIVLDLGSGQIDMIRELEATVIICDHHVTPVLKQVMEKKNEGINGREGDNVSDKKGESNNESKEESEKESDNQSNKKSDNESNEKGESNIECDKKGERGNEYDKGSEEEAGPDDRSKNQKPLDIAPFAPLKTEKGMVYEFNSHKFGIDGSYAACAASLTYAFATALSRMNSPSSAIALAGIFGDRQSSPLLGLNKEVVDEGIAQGYIQEKKSSLLLDGQSVREALTYSVDPYFPGITGRESAVETFLKDCGIEGSKSPEVLALNERRYLTDRLMLILLKNNSPPEAIKRIVGTRYFLSEFGVHADTLSNRINACGRQDRMNTGVAVCLGERTAMDMATRLREKYRSTIRNGLVYLESRGVKKMDNIQYFFNNDPASSGAFAGLGIQFLFNRHLPIIALSKKHDKVHISSRGTRELVNKGLDLSTAMRDAGSIVGGHGGGHPIAAGASIPKGKENEFLGIVNGIVGKQFEG